MKFTKAQDHAACIASRKIRFDIAMQAKKDLGFESSVPPLSHQLEMLRYEVDKRVDDYYKDRMTTLLERKRARKRARESAAALERRRARKNAAALERRRAREIARKHAAALERKRARKHAAALKKLRGQVAEKRRSPRHPRLLIYGSIVNIS